MLTKTDRIARPTLAVRAFLAHVDLKASPRPAAERIDEIGTIASKELLVAALRAQTRAVKLLARAIQPAHVDHRPAPGQRSIIELLRYLTMCALAPATHAVTGSWSQAKALVAASAKLGLADIPAALDAQLAAIERLLAPIPDGEFATRPAKAPWGARCTLAESLTNGALKFLACYREELALHARAAGAAVR